MFSVLSPSLTRFTVRPDVPKVLPFRAYLYRLPSCRLLECVVFPSVRHRAPVSHFVFRPAVHVIRVHAIHDKSRSVLGVMGALLGVQIVITAISCGFFRCTSCFPVRSTSHS